MAHPSVLRPALGVAGVALAALLTSCAIGNSATVTLSRTTTIGQELIDLKKAFDDGLISDSDYAEAKRSILQQANWQEFAERRNR